MENENKKAVNTTRKFYSMRETAEILGIAYITVFENCKRGNIPSVKVGQKRLVSVDYIDRLVEQSNSTGK